MTSKIFPFSLLLSPFSFLFFPLILSACDDNSEPYVVPEEVVVDITPALADSVWNLYMTSDFQDAVESVPLTEDMPYYEDFAKNWLAGEETRDIEITFDGNTASVDWLEEGKKTKAAVKVSIEGSHVVIRNEDIDAATQEAAGRARMNYILSGTSDDASVRIYSNKKFMVTLDGATLSNPKGSVINAQKSLEKKRMFLNIADGTVNSIADATEYSDTIAGEDDKAAIFSEGKMIVMGKGTLNVTGNYSHALAADDRIYIHSGTKLNLISNAKDALHAKDEIILGGGLIRAFALKDALQCTELYLKGGRLLAAGKRAATAPVFDYQGGDFCLVGNETDHPSAATCAWDSIPVKGYSIIVSK